MKNLLFLTLLLGAAHQVLAQPLVVTGDRILASLVEQVAGGSVRVEALLPSGTASAEFEPGDEQVALLNEADLLVVNGAGYEPWLTELERQSTFAGPVVTTTDGVALYDLDGTLHEVEVEEVDAPEFFAVAVELDPHAWHDPRNVVTYVEHIRNGLTDLLFGTARSVMEENVNELIRDLRETHSYAEVQLATIPPADRVLVTPHDTLRYFAAAYGFRIIPITGLASGQDLRPALEGRLIDTILSLRTPAVFFESTANRRLLQRLEEATGSRMVTSLRTTEPGARGSGADTYIGWFRANVDAIVGALRDPNAPVPTAP